MGEKDVHFGKARGRKGYDMVKGANHTYKNLLPHGPRGLYLVDILENIGFLKGIFD